MTDDVPDDLTECAKALCCDKDQCRSPNDCDAMIFETEARACLRASSLLRDAMELLDDVYVDAGPALWFADRAAVLARYRKLMED